MNISASAAERVAIMGFGVRVEQKMGSMSAAERGLDL
jgi:hypothetical protein